MYKQITIAMIFLYYLVSCGGGGVGGLIAEGGIDGTGLGVGSISGFSSVIVNGVRYDTEETEVIINGEPATTDDLQLGMYVNVIGAQDIDAGEGVAQQIEYNDTLLGQVESVNLGARAFRALGQTIQTTDETQFYGFSDLSELQRNDSIRVSGAAIPGAGQVRIEATLLERLAMPTDNVAIVGQVGRLNTTAQQFFIAGLAVNYATAQTIPEELQESMTVEVKGRRIGQRGNMVEVDSIRELLPVVLPEDSVVQIRGNVTRFNTLNDMDVQFIPVSIAEDLADGVVIGAGTSLRLTGRTDADGVVVVETLEVFSGGDSPARDPNRDPYRISGPVQSLDLPQLINVFGVNVRLSEQTRYRDITAPNREYGPEEIRIGDQLAIAGGINAAGELTADLVTFNPSARTDRSDIQGPFSNADSVNRQLEIFGVPVLTGEITTYFDVSQVEGFELPPVAVLFSNIPADTEVDAATFFERLQASPDALVYTTGRVEGNTNASRQLVLLPFRVGE